MRGPKEADSRCWGSWDRNAHWCLLTNFFLLSPELVRGPGDHSHALVVPSSNGIPGWFREEVVLRKSKPRPQGCRSSHWGLRSMLGGSSPAGWRGDLCGCYYAAGMNFRAPHLKEKVANSVQEQVSCPSVLKGLGRRGDATCSRERLLVPLALLPSELLFRALLVSFCSFAVLLSLSPPWVVLKQRGEKPTVALSGAQTSLHTTGGRTTQPEHLLILLFPLAPLPPDTPW